MKIEITVDKKNRSDLAFLLGFRGLPKINFGSKCGKFWVITSIAFAEDYNDFCSTFATHLNPEFKSLVCN